MMQVDASSSARPKNSGNLSKAGIEAHEARRSLAHSSEKARLKRASASVSCQNRKILPAS